MTFLCLLFELTSQSTGFGFRGHELWEWRWWNDSRRVCGASAGIRSSEGKAQFVPGLSNLVVLEAGGGHPKGQQHPQTFDQALKTLHVNTNQGPRPIPKQT